MLPSDIGGIGGLFVMVLVFCLVIVPLIFVYGAVRKWWQEKKDPDPFKNVYHSLDIEDWDNEEDEP